MPLNILWAPFSAWKCCLRCSCNSSDLYCRAVQTWLSKGIFANGHLESCFWLLPFHWLHNDRSVSEYFITRGMDTHQRGGASSLLNPLSFEFTKTLYMVEKLRFGKVITILRTQSSYASVRLQPLYIRNETTA